ncbi:hypothetical protein R3P38DRAFT_3191637 [Favolaschia claudopus]|uniref:Uncharacterized protein n=1 Tax=Favolaschia claudopus TaxID=2862362 RepID=A0AAW0BKK1_9AGAR
MAELWLRDPYLPPFEEDQHILNRTPLAEVFPEWVGSSLRSEMQTLKASLSSQLMADNFWLTTISDWLALVFGGEVDEGECIEEQVDLFIDIMWMRFRHHDSVESRADIMKLLLPARRSLIVKPYISAPAAEFSIVGDLNADDIAGLAPSKQADIYSLVFGSDSDLSDLSEEENASQNNDFIMSAVETEDVVMQPVETGERDDRYISMFEARAEEIAEFFFPAREEHSKPRNCKPLVEGLVSMRKVKDSLFMREDFQASFRGSELYKVLLIVCNPYNPLENSHPDVQQSFRLYNWKVAYGQILDRWDPLSPEVNLPPLIERGHSKFNAEHFLRFFGKRAEIHPWVAYPTACTFLVSEDAFKSNCEHWLIPWLRHAKYETAGWDLTTVYRQICQHPVMTGGADHTRQVKRLLNDVDPCFAAILLETRRYKKTLDTINEEIFTKTRTGTTTANSGSGDQTAASDDPTVADLSSTALPAWYTEKGCAGCSGQPDSDRCVRFIEVEDRSDFMREYEYYSLTVHEGSERLVPKKKGTDDNLGPQKYVSPQELGLREITARPSDHPVWTTCQRDIVRLVYREGNKLYLVGGFRYKAFSEPTLKLLEYNSLLIETRAMRRRAAMQRWDYGLMSGAGTRMPTGGRKGDGYILYSVHRGDTIDDIKAFFRSALDSDILIIAAKSIYQGIEFDFKTLTNDSGLQRLGKYGLTSYYCVNYIAPIHRDLDIEKEGRRYLHPCMQLVKEGCGEHDFNFAYVDWGVYFRTESNAVWCVSSPDIDQSLKANS